MTGRAVRLIGLGLVSCAVTLAVACKSSTDAGVTVTVSGPSTQTVGQTNIFTAPGLTDATCTWTSSNEGVATVTSTSATDATVTGVAVGTATITATCTASTGTTHGSEVVTITAAPNIDGTYTTNLISSTSSCVAPVSGVSFVIVGGVGYFGGNPGFSGPITLVEAFTNTAATVSGLFTPPSNPSVFGGGCTGIPSVSFTLIFNQQTGAGSGNMVVTYPGQSATTVGVSVTGKS